MSPTSLIFTILVFAILLTGGFMALFISLVVPEGYHRQSFQRRSHVEKSSKRSVPDIKEYPFLISVRVPMYKNGKNSWLFTCSTISVSTNIVLLFHTCFHHYTPKEFLNVAELRCNSSYFSKEGTVFKLENIVEHRTNIFLGHAENSVVLNNPNKIYDGQPSQSSEYLLIGWGDEKCHMYGYGYEDPFFVTEWYLENDPRCSSTKHLLSGSWTDEDRDDNAKSATGRILVTAKTKELVAVQVDTCLRFDVDTKKPLLFRRLLSTDWKDGGTAENSHLKEKICRPVSTTFQ